MSARVLLLVGLLSYGHAKVDASEWVYEKGSKGEGDWDDHHVACSGRRQSPIAFWDDDVSVNHSLPVISFIDYDRKISGVKVENNGHTVKLIVPEGVEPKIRGGMLPDSYRLAQIHFHWGPRNKYGSEHMFGHDHFPMEMHLVHVRGKKSLEQALRDPQGLAVLGIFYEVSNEVDNTLTPITNVIEELAYKDDKATISSLNLFSLLPHDTSNFFTYYGSLTTPPCSEVVIWTVFTETHAISVSQLRQFRNVHVHDDEEGKADVGDKLLFNHREVQPLNGRPVYARRHKIGLVRKCSYTSAAERRGRSFLLLFSCLLLLPILRPVQ